MWWLKTNRQHNNEHWYQERRERTSDIFTRDSRKTRTRKMLTEGQNEVKLYSCRIYESFLYFSSFMVTERSSVNVEKYENDIFQSSVLVYS
jgi:hypothetical protein